MRFFPDGGRQPVDLPYSTEETKRILTGLFGARIGRHPIAWVSQITGSSGAKIGGGELHSAFVPQVSYTGWWIFLVPESLWSTLAMPGNSGWLSNARRALSALARDGARDLEAALAVTDGELRAVHSVGQRRVNDLRRWEREVFVPWKERQALPDLEEFSGDVASALCALGDAK